MEYGVYRYCGKLSQGDYIQPFVCHFMTGGILRGPIGNKISVIVL